jgi:hypothetical protein
MDGEAVAAADRAEVYVPPAPLREALGITEARLEAAADPGFRPRRDPERRRVSVKT